MIGYGTTLRVRRQARDSDGDRTGPGVDHTWPGWMIAPASSTESSDGTRDTTTDRLQAYGGPAELDLGPGDRVYLDGDDAQAPPPWQVAGRPERWAAFEWNAGWVVTLQRISG